MNVQKMRKAAADAGEFLRALGHEGRLMILCQLVEGERSVGALADMLDMRQSAVSQQLARLRREGLVAPRRSGQTVYYGIADPRARDILELLYALFCAGAERPKE